jgi:ParB/RepB/Spo0J family partition protein
MMSTRIEKIAIKDIKILGGRRSVKQENVQVLADSMFKIGLNTPITVRKGKTGPILVAGLHRLEAAKLLGWKKIAAVQLSGSKSDARLWKGSENLHRADLTVLERSIEIERWRRHFREVAKGAQVARPGGR